MGADDDAAGLGAGVLLGAGAALLLAEAEATAGKLVLPLGPAVGVEAFGPRPINEDRPGTPAMATM